MPGVIGDVPLHRLYSGYDGTAGTTYGAWLGADRILDGDPQHSGSPLLFSPVNERGNRVPNLLHALDDTIDVEYSQFLVQEVCMFRSPLALPGPTGEWVAIGKPGGLLLHSAANDHYPTVRLELWDGAPPAAARNWDQVVDLTCDLESGVRLQSITATYSPHTLEISRQGAHHARVHVGNQDEAAELDEGTFETGVERWLIQLWLA